MFCCNCFSSVDLAPLERRRWNTKEKEWDIKRVAWICRECATAPPDVLSKRHKLMAMNVSEIANLRSIPRPAAG